MKQKRLSAKKRREIIESVFGKVPLEKFEPGIYNDCDRWCEKCDKTEKCFLYFQTSEEGPSKDFESCFKNVEKSLGQTKELIQKICQAEGIDLTMTPKEEAEYREKERLTNPYSEPFCIKAKNLTKMIYDWLDSVPSLDIKEYRDAYDKLSWHGILIGAKACVGLKIKREIRYEKGSSKKFAKEHANKYGWMGYRSTLICKQSLELMDGYVNDFRIKPMIQECQVVLDSIDQNLLSIKLRRNK